VTGYLLDTGIILLASSRFVALSSESRSAIQRGPVFLSVISYWEVVIKNMKGKLDVGDPRSWWTDALEQLGARVLPLHSGHVAEIPSLAPFHTDPFDRSLIAQATVENLTLITTDADIQRYASDSFRVVV
jgi:PIN domain nuclease of toxin-antitoxin system